MNKTEIAITYNTVIHILKISHRLDDDCIATSYVGNIDLRSQATRNDFIQRTRFEPLVN